MNKDMLQGSWVELKGKIRTRWGKFTDNDMESFKGNLEQIIGKIQKVYGHTKEKAEQEYNDFKISMGKSAEPPADPAKTPTKND